MMRLLSVMGVLGGLVACGANPEVPRIDADPDLDGDGVRGSEDCDDEDSSAFPGATEVCGDLVDQDCDGETPMCGSAETLWPTDEIAAFGTVSSGGVGASLTLTDLDGDGADEAITSMLNSTYTGATLHAWGGTPSALGPPGYGVSTNTAVALHGDGDRLLVGAALSDQVHYFEGGIATPLWAQRTGDSRLGLGVALVDELAVVAANERLVFLELAGGTEVGSFTTYSNDLHAVGDLDGDGAGEVLVATFALDNTVRVFTPESTALDASAVSLSIAGVIYSHLAEGAASGDLDGDGLPDLVLGAPSDCTNGEEPPTVFVFSQSSGALTLDDALTRIEGESACDRTGTSVAVADLDGDGQDDLAFGAPGFSPGGGAVYAMAGPIPSGTMGAGEVDRRWVVADRDLLGSSLVAGDLDGDGALELIAGAPEADVSNPSLGKEGALFLFSPAL